MKTTPNITYPIHEIFHSFQGEGLHTGRSAAFIRLFGCPVHCPWCDSAGTWHKDHVPKHIVKLAPDSIYARVMETPPDIVVITGGEPTIHNLSPLVEYLTDHLPRPTEIHLETSGAFEFGPRLFDWITVSPKKWKMPLVSSLQAANEIKIILDSYVDLSFYISQTRAHWNPEAIVRLHPEWGAFNRDPENLKKVITQYVKEHGKPFRAGFQLHKIYKADTLDMNSRLPVPLGGDPKQGY